jgi:predicted RNA-binding Zn-ribbon protein involved in translation (DUF1610 family)
MLICENTACRFLVDLSEGGLRVSRSSLVISGCPECGYSWLDRCPHCSSPLDVKWNAQGPHCVACDRSLRRTGQSSDA